MKRFKRTVAYVLAAVLSFSSFLQPVPVFAAEESAKVMEISGEQKTEETKAFNVSVTEGKGSIEVRDEEGNISKAAPEEPLSLDCPAGSFFEITAIPEYGYQAAVYKTMTDTGEVKEEILTPALENGHYTARINVDEISSIEIGFSEISPEESGDLEVKEIPEETPAEDPEETLTEEPEDVTAVPDITDLNASDFASMRLVVLADDASVIVDDSDIIGRYENVYLLQFSSIQQVMNAYVYYKDKVTAVEPDAVVETASEDNGPKDIASISMDSEMNPIEVLNDVETSEEVLDAHGMIALIDTGVSEGEHVMARVSVIDDKLEGNGHGNDMLEAIISQDAEGKILSIRAMDDKGIGTISSLVAGMEYAIKQKVDIINLSVYAKATLATSVLKQEIQKAAAAGILVVGAAGNDSADAAGYMPGSVDEAYIIGAAKEDGTRLDMSNFGETVDYNVVADSTSEAAALFTGFVSANGLEAVKDILNQGLVFAADYTSEPVTEEPAEDGQEYVGVSAEEAAMYEAGLIPTVEPNLVKTYTAEQLKEDLPEDTFTVAAGDTTVSEYGSNSLADVAGVNREPIMNWLGGHVSTDYYLSTPYNPGWIENSGMSADYRNPNGDCQGAYGAGDTEGQAGMNCTGFVWHALTKAGGTEIPALSGWVSFIRNNNIRYRTYTGSDITDIINTILYEDDWIEPGDIIWMWDAAAGKMNNGLSYGISNYHHVGIYVGAAFDNSDPYNASPGWFHKDNGDINGFWHSTDHGIPDSYAPGNMISNILPKTTCMAITVMKTDTAEAKGGIAITKSSAKPEMTDGNSAYSLAGAEYGVYKQGTEEQVATLVTDVNGYGKVEDIPAGNYDIRELKAPAGYALDTATGTVTVTGGQTVAYSCQDTPQSNPVAVLLRKVEADKNKTQTQASASLANAEFTVKYYKGIYDTDPVLQGIDPERTWIMKTNEKGDLPFDEKAKISGDDLYYMTNGNPALPLGTVTIQETKAPAGFLLNQEIFIRQITSDGTAETVATYDQPTVPETSQKGIIRLQKSDSERNTAQGQASLAGAIYEIRNSSNEVVSTIITDNTGKGESERLPLGAYTVKEKTASLGYQVDPQTYTVELTAEDASAEVFYKSVSSKEDIIRGGVTVEKWDSELNKKNAQGTATLEGTQIQIISQNDQEILADGKVYKKGEVITTLTTDEEGKAGTSADFLPYGSYQFKEVKQPGGYTSAGIITRNFEIRENRKIIQMNTSDTVIKNEVIRGGVAVEKWDSELNKRAAQGEATLEGAKIQIISRNEQTVLVGEKEYKKGEVVATLTTDKEGKAGTSADFLPYGDYQLKETLPPTGYTSGGTITRNFEIREDGKIVQMNTSDTAVKNEVIRGGVTIAKWSLETNERKTQGGAALDGAKFTVTNCSAKAVLVDGQLYQPGEVIATVETGEDGLWTSEKDWLPYGTYEVAEVQEPDGYLPDGAQARNFQIREDGKIVSLDNNEGAIKNQVKRGDLNFVKVADSTLERLENVPFKITSKTTGESHIVVSDRNGQVDTSSAWNLHSQNTNRGETSEDGVWFSGTTEKEVPVNDEKGALPYDTYRIEEQRCEANEGYKLLSIEITVYRDNYTIPLGTLTDDSDLAEIATTAIDSDTQDHYAAAGENTTITDTVEYTNLNKGEEYTLKGTLMNKATGEPVTDDEENPVTAEKTFTAKKVKGTAEMTFTFDSTKLAGADIVVFEELYQKENLIAEHTDITDEEQTIHFPEIGTKAMDQETNTNVSKADREITLVDTVSYSNLQPGKKYKLMGTLMDKETGEPVKDAQGKEITAETSFKPETSDGTVNVTFAFDGSNLAGKTLVVFESLERNDTVYAVHTDINDQAQTIYFPGIGTTAKEAVSGTKFGKADKITLVDTVSYRNLTPGTEYILKGILMDKETGESVKVGGQEVTAEATFKPEEASGTADVTFAFDASSLAGHTLVVFEELFQTEASVAEHKDITDEGQTIYIPRIGTTALDKETGNHSSNPDEKVTIVDTVTYKGLIPGKEYTVKGTLMDKSTGKELQADGKTVIAEKTFTAEKAEGSVELTFTFDGRALAGRTVVAFEHVYYKDKEVGSHTDIEDEDQSIHFPAMGTTAKGSSTKDHIANAGKVKILDTVSYKNLIPGRKYTLKGVLMDKATGKELLIDEKKVTAEKEFTPKMADGSVDLEYTFDASALAGKQVVVYEELYTSDKLIGEHKDINDEGQTVTFPWLRTNASDGVTGKHVGTVSEKATVIDVVSYKGLLPGKEYTIKGTLMNKETGEPVKNSEGKDITAEKTFTPENEEGSVELVYELDSTLLAGQTAVVFEDLLYNGVEVGSHGDIQDEGQSVHYSDLGTQAKDKNTGLQEGIRKEQSVIADTVAYQNLIPGQEYTLKGILMNKSTGTPLLINKKEITAEKTFIPETADGTVVLKFFFDSTVLKNSEIVVFESLFVKDKEVNAHRDLNDKGQTVKYPEHKIQTQARDKESETQEARAKADTTILDTVTYEGLIPGQRYTLKGMLMDKSTGEPLLINEKQITAEKTFIPEKSSGREELEFTFDASIAAGKEIVVFERLYVQEIEVASHTDLEDENQTVKIKVPEEPKTEKKETPGSPEKEQETAKTFGTASVKTGDEAPIGELICILTFSGVVIAVIMKKKRSKKR